MLRRAAAARWPPGLRSHPPTAPRRGLASQHRLSKQSKLSTVPSLFLEYPDVRKEFTQMDAPDGSIRVTLAATRGYRASMEDASVLEVGKFYKQSPTRMNTVFGIFDGHGGLTASDYASKVFIDTLVACPEFHAKAPEALRTALRATFATIDDQLRDPSKWRPVVLEAIQNRAKKRAERLSEEQDEHLEQLARRHLIKLVDPVPSSAAMLYVRAMRDTKAEEFLDAKMIEDLKYEKLPDSGCAAIAGVVRGSALTLAHAGDCRAVLSKRNGRFVALTQDHTPEDPEEQQRILEAGHTVQDGRVDGVLNLSRGLGDFEYKNQPRLPLERQAVTCVPDVSTYELDEADEFIIVASDGVWTFNRNWSVVEFFRKRLMRTSPSGQPQAAGPEEVVAAMEDFLDAGLLKRDLDNTTLMIIQLMPGYFKKPINPSP